MLLFYISMLLIHHSHTIDSLSFSVSVACESYCDCMRAVVDYNIKSCQSSNYHGKNECIMY